MARIAPTPSGYLHAGNVANFLLNARLAGQGGELLLRIDDLDNSRFRENYLEDIFFLLDHIRIHWTRGPRNPEDFHANWSQEHRMKAYGEALEILRGHPLVFACRCTRRELRGANHAHGCLEKRVPLTEAGAAWRVNTRELGWLTFPNPFGNDPFVVNVHRDVPDFAIRKKDGRPSYQTGSVVDDLSFGVTHLARGEDLLPSTAAQRVLADMLGKGSVFAGIEMVHHPLLMGEDGRKLSKSAGAQSQPLTEDPSFNLAAVEEWVEQLIARAKPNLFDPAI